MLLEVNWIMVNTQVFRLIHMILCPFTLMSGGRVVSFVAISTAHSYSLLE